MAKRKVDLIDAAAHILPNVPQGFPLIGHEQAEIACFDRMELEILEDWLLLDFVKSGNTIRGIFVPDAWRDTKMPIWRVRQVGPGRWVNGELKPMTIPVGAYVIINPTAAELCELPTEQTQSLLIREPGIMLVIKNAESLGFELKGNNGLVGASLAL